MTAMALGKLATDENKNTSNTPSNRTQISEHLEVFSELTLKHTVHHLCDIHAKVFDITLTGCSVPYRDK